MAIGLPTPPTYELAGHVTADAIRQARRNNPGATIVANGRTVALSSRIDLQMNADQAILPARREFAPPTLANNMGYNNALGRPLVESASGSIMAGNSIGGASQPSGTNIRVFGPSLSMPTISPSTL